MEMREALVDLAYLELKCVSRCMFLDVDYMGPTERSRYDDVLAWLQRNRMMLFSSRALGMEVWASQSCATVRNLREKRDACERAKS